LNCEQFSEFTTHSLFIVSIARQNAVLLEAVEKLMRGHRDAADFAVNRLNAHRAQDEERIAAACLFCRLCCLSWSDYTSFVSKLHSVKRFLRDRCTPGAAEEDRRSQVAQAAGIEKECKTAPIH
jgi:hypothetical protein